MHHRFLLSASSLLRSLGTALFFVTAIAFSYRADAQEPIIVDSVVLSPLKVAELPAEQTGVLREWIVKEGTTVERGAVIAKLDDRQAQLDLAKAELEVEQALADASNEVNLRYAEKSAEVAAAELRRSEESIAQFAKSVSQSQLDVERLTVEKLKLEQEQARHELEVLRLKLKLKQQELAAARLRLEQHAIRAPFAGTIALVRGRVGEWVETGQAVARLVAVEKLRAEGFVDATALDANSLGSKVIFRIPGEDDAPNVEGTLQFISPEMDPVTRQVRIWAEIDNTQQILRAGQQGELVILN